MHRRPIPLFLAVAFAGTTAPAQDTQPSDASPTSTAPTSAPSSQPTTAPATQPAGPLALNYSGDLWRRRALTGDWLGGRNWLAEHGVTFDVQVVQYLQGNASGGRSTDGAFEYSGAADYAFNFDFGKMGLLPGGFGRIRAETKFGRDINADAGAISSPNFNSLLPMPGDPGLTTLTEYWIIQYVSEKLGFIAGQVDLTGLPGQNAFASDRYAHFMNTSLWQNPVAFSTVPYSTMTAGAFYAPTKWFDGATLICDSYGTATHSGFYEAFHAPQAVSIIQAFNFHIKPFGLPGTQRLNFSYSTRPRYALEDIDRLILSGAAAPSFDRLNIGQASATGGGSVSPRRVAARAVLSRLLEPEPESGSWAFWYDFDQYIHRELDDPNQGWGVFGRFGWSPGETNPVSTFYSLGVGGTGIIPTRDRDRLGLGYYLLDISNELPSRMRANVEQGVELFYNIEVTPWLHITPDIQIIINPGGDTGESAWEPAFVYGLRMQMNF